MNHLPASSLQNIRMGRQDHQYPAHFSAMGTQDYDIVPSFLCHTLHVVETQ